MRWRLAANMALALVLVTILVPSAGAHPAPASRVLLHLSSVRMITAAHGWGTSGSHVFRTTSGASNWLDVTPRGVPIGRHAAAFFLDDAHAWLAVNGQGYYDTSHPTLYRTSNAGRNWAATRIMATGMVGDGRLFFLTANDGWLFLIQGLGAGQAPYVLLRTTDGGARWLLATRSGMNGPANAQLPGCNCTGAIAFRTPLRGWATGNPGAYPYSSWLYTTGNSGRTWKRQPLVLPRGYRYSTTEAPIFFGTLGLLPVSLQGGSGATPFELFVTRDGGSTWKGTKPLPLAATAHSFVDSSTGWVASGGTMFMTLDAGNHWTVVTRHGPLGRAGFGDGEIQFGDYTTGYAVVNLYSRSQAPNFFKTIDAGRTWRAIPTYRVGVLRP